MAIKNSFPNYKKKDLFKNIFKRAIKVDKAVIMMITLLVCFFLLTGAHPTFTQGSAQLSSESVLQKSKPVKSNLQKDVALAGTLLAVILVSLFYFVCRNKRRSNLNLQTKQDIINRQNNELLALVKEKEKLLIEKDELIERQHNLITEKEWLLEEVHHRVKNNLQVVMSLLYTQAAYLHNTNAIEAIRDSQNRVQAISIIHQTLYSESNVSLILMSDYIKELVRHLCDRYECQHRKISFKEQLEPINLDISQAIPLGLILNEAITNALKYAFGTDGGQIIVQGQILYTDAVKLTVADNGVGLPGDFNLAETSSLGMEMMKALSKQLGGSLEISGDAGVIVTVLFKIENQLRMAKL